MNGWAQKTYFEEKSFSEKMLKNMIFLEAVNQLKKTSDCIKIDPPGPGQNLKKSKKRRKKKNDPDFLIFFHVFTVKTHVFGKKSPNILYDFLGMLLQGIPFKGMPLKGMPLKGMPLKGIPLKGMPLGFPHQALLNFKV